MIDIKPGKWIAFDFDGTLAYDNPGRPHDGELGEPIPEMIKFAKDWISQGYEVRILTARVYCPQDEYWTPALANEVASQRIKLMDWTEKHIGKRLKVTCMKDPNMGILYDDRAVGVVRNKGVLVCGH